LHPILIQCIVYTSNNCSNKFKFEAQDTSSFYSYLWRFGSGIVNDTTIYNPEIDFSADGKVFFEYIVVSGGKCISVAPKDSN
jgi:hypothetical protein